MQILHILEDFSTASGGLRTVVKNLDEKLKSNNHNSFIISNNKDVSDSIYNTIYSKWPWLFSLKWKRSLRRIIEEETIDAFHIHGTWMYPQYKAAKFAIKHKIPFVVTPHGMFEPWLWRKGTLKKKFYFNVLIKPLYKKASVIHAITKEEKENLSKLFPETTIKVIPNLIDTCPYHPYNYNQEKYVLFVGRIDQKKGIDLLINAFAQVKQNHFKLKIAGQINAYKLELDKLIKSLCIEDKVEFLGLIKDEVKTFTYRNAFIFVAPSHSEVIGMVNLEAAVYGVPVITTYQTGLSTDWSHNGGQLINPNLDELSGSLDRLLTMNSEERNTNGKLLYDFVNKEYAWDTRFKSWTDLYAQILI